MNWNSKANRRHAIAVAVAAFAILLLVRCASAPAGKRGLTNIEACGTSFDIGTRVVRWHEPGGYDAYRREKFFTKEDVPDGKLRY